MQNNKQNKTQNKTQKQNAKPKAVDTYQTRSKSLSKRAKQKHPPDLSVGPFISHPTPCHFIHPNPAATRSLASLFSKMSSIPTHIPPFA
jgi:hypothetical protein